MYKYYCWVVLIFILTFIFLNRPQRARMRFWAKGKQGEKKTTRVKPASHLEVSAFVAGSDMIPAHPFPDGKSGQKGGDCLPNSYLFFLKVGCCSSIHNGSPVG